MASPNDTTTGSGATPIHDQRAAPRGVLPRQLQMWLMIGLAVVIWLIILFTGRPAPARASAVTRTSEPSLMAPARLQTYQRQLAEDGGFAVNEGADPRAKPAAANRMGETPRAHPIADEQRRRSIRVFRRQRGAQLGRRTRHRMGTHDDQPDGHGGGTATGGSCCFRPW